MNVYAFKITQEIKEQTIHLKSNNLRDFLQSIKNLPLKIIEKSSSRYSNINTDEERSIVFYDEIIDSVNIANNYIPALFIKRRGKTRPYEEDGEGNLTELELKQEGHQIAEIGFILFCIEEGIALWIFNHFVGGINKMNEYLNSMYIRSNFLNKDEIDFKQYGSQSSLNFNYILYPDSLNDFKNNFFDISNLEFNLASTNDELKEAFLFGHSDGDGISLMRHFIERSNCSKISFKLGSQNTKKKDNKTKLNNQGLNKEFLMNFYDETLPYLESKHSSKFTVKGKNKIDDEMKVLDLINSKLIYQLRLKYEGATLPLHTIVQEMVKLAKSKMEEMRRFI